MLHWKRLKAYCDESGDTPDAVDKRVRSGIWLRGVHVNIPEGSRETWVNELAVNDWAAGRRPATDHGKPARAK